MILPRLQAAVSRDRAGVIASMVYAVATAALATIHKEAVLYGVMIIAGAAGSGLYRRCKSRHRSRYRHGYEAVPYRFTSWYFPPELRSAAFCGAGSQRTQASPPRC